MSKRPLLATLLAATAGLAALPSRGDDGSALAGATRKARLLAGAAFVLPDIPVTPGTKPAWEGHLGQWLKDLGNDDVGVREKTTEEMSKETDPEFEERLGALLPGQSDPEVKARLGMILEKLLEDRLIRELRAKLSPRLLESAPRIAENAYSTEGKDLRAALNQMVPPTEGRNNEFHPEHMAASPRDVQLIFPIIMSSLERLQADVTALDNKTKRLIWEGFDLNFETLTKTDAMKKPVRYFRGLLKDPSPFYRGQAIAELSVYAPDAQTRGDAVAMLGDPSPTPRYWAIDALDRMDAKDKEPEVLRLLNDPGVLVRRICVHFLHRQAGPADEHALEGVVARLSDSDKGVIFEAMLTLSDWGKLDEALLASRPETAAQVIDILKPWADAGSDKYRKTLESLTRHRDPGVALVARRALENKPNRTR